jgi:hypothetical protein
LLLLLLLLLFYGILDGVVAAPDFFISFAAAFASPTVHRPCCLLLFTPYAFIASNEHTLYSSDSCER